MSDQRDASMVSNGSSQASSKLRSVMGAGSLDVFGRGELPPEQAVAPQNSAGSRYFMPRSRALSLGETMQLVRLFWRQLRSTTQSERFDPRCERLIVG